MSDLDFECTDVSADLYAAAPTLQVCLRVSETTGARVHAVALRCQIRIDPVRRSYSPAEERRLLDLFGATPRWGETLKPLQFATVGVLVPAFTGATDVELPVACTYDFEVAAAKYLHGVREGEVPLQLLFSGTVFEEGPTGYSVTPVPWSKETAFRMPARTWHQLMDAFFPGSGWIRVRRDTLDRLQRFKAERALPSWERAFDLLLAGQAPMAEHAAPQQRVG